MFLSNQMVVYLGDICHGKNVMHISFL